MTRTLAIEPADRESLSGKVYTRLLDAILQREYEPGEKLSIRQLAVEMGISTMPVKEAVNRLAFEGLLQIVPNSGTYVAAISMREVGELFDLRIALELLAAEKVITRIDNAILQQYREVLKQSAHYLNKTEKAKSYLKFMEKDARFHRLLIEAVNNRKYLEIYDSLNLDLYVARCAFVAGVENTQSMHTYLIDVQAQHEIIYQAILNKDLDAVKRALIDHTETSRNTITEAISKAQDVFV